MDALAPATGMNILTKAARVAARVLAVSPTDQRDAALRAAANALRAQTAEILEANARDVAASQANAAFRDRLTLDQARVEAMAKGLEEIAELPDPLRRVLSEWTRPNGLLIRRVAVPIGVIGMIYESRPNVGADAAGLCIKSGNAVILRGGSESFHSARAIQKAIEEGLRAVHLPEACVQIVPDTDRAYVATMLDAAGMIDLIIPRGGKSLVERVQREARVPVLAHAEGLCHTYIDARANPDMARQILANAKMRRTGICGATETLLIDEAIAPSLLPTLIDDLSKLGCAFVVDERARAIRPDLPLANAQDFSTEWLDAKLSVAVVDGVEQALAHIAHHGSGHTEAIITEDAETAEKFLNGTDSAVVMWNASTQFCDGGEFGFGAEIGISTGKLHARGPVGLEQLTTFRYEVRGNGQIRA
ncbi:glutamate-5-semialdehyde dehydrogenase [Kozakia baliensis]|uniref:Gamma-glutamyl phosphate reductase n=1 Tax=Kozakia baliensis TaxID=153496 RepID=A0A1D8UVY3_9PROT|nr:glutamate-5-semialdehyde dehydrogenase [Kozakia baliensis]AOX17796.1 gamma-glutamyl-phosphate reductase [Kozakia baliensis]GBR33704.1 gamma-glutamyl phosphate reductase [Kozakia baliensis NRIC 0488]GEL64874.1 gamma-glutamyl phosphate reductase [Kozakia baliensis]